MPSGAFLEDPLSNLPSVSVIFLFLVTVKVIGWVVEAKLRLVKENMPRTGVIRVFCFFGVSVFIAAEASTLVLTA